MGNVFAQLTLRRVAAMREMADLGIPAIQVAMLLDIEKAKVSELRKKFGITFKPAKKGKPAWLQKLIIRDYGKPGMTVPVMAERYGTTSESIYVRMAQLRKEGKLPPVQERC